MNELDPDSSMRQRQRIPYEWDIRRAKRRLWIMRILIASSAISAAVTIAVLIFTNPA